MSQFRHCLFASKLLISCVNIVIARRRQFYILPFFIRDFCLFFDNLHRLKLLSEIYILANLLFSSRSFSSSENFLEAECPKTELVISHLAL